VIALTTSADNWIALGIAVAGVLYLFAVLIHPERF
jgi:K+-transporting ATPase KdpF subunit